ncbi:MAG: hypothetical protein Q7S02_03535, partial [bacterium]|nr:hypothetical protein [bacterium]
RGGAVLRDTWTDLAPDAWVPDDLTMIAVEFELDAIAALLEEILHGTVTKDERSLERRRKRAEHEAAVRRAYAHVVVLNADERCALGDHLMSLGIVSVQREYMAMDMGDMQDWLSSTRCEMRDTLVLDAFQAGAELVAINPLDENGGLVTAQLSQVGGTFTWHDRVRGIEALDALRPGSARDQREAYVSLERDVAVLTQAELDRVGPDQLEFVATLDASVWPRAHRQLEPDDEQSRVTYAGHIVPFLRRKAAAVGGTVVVYEQDAVTEEVRGAKVYRPRPAVPS